VATLDEVIKPLQSRQTDDVYYVRVEIDCHPGPVDRAIKA
jgi:hypothetical protein